MLQPHIRVPFIIDDIYGGFAKASGLLRIESDALLLEFQVQENLFGGLMKGKPKVFRIPITALDSVEFKKTWFNSKLIIRVMRLRDLDGVPGAQEGEAKLKIRKQDRERAKEIASQVSIRLSEIRLSQMDDLE
ncbi:MAG: hypothetical protein NWR72_21060 [Bacteroidia bacterium]|nr:hypothetical protein [Bacteroidia bacterium]